MGSSHPPDCERSIWFRTKAPASVKSVSGSVHARPPSVDLSHRTSAVPCPSMAAWEVCRRYVTPASWSWKSTGFWAERIACADTICGDDHFVPPTSSRDTTMQTPSSPSDPENQAMRKTPVGSSMMFEACASTCALPVGGIINAAQGPVSSDPRGNTAPSNGHSSELLDSLSLKYFLTIAGQPSTVAVMSVERLTLVAFVVSEPVVGGWYKKVVRKLLSPSVLTAAKNVKHAPKTMRTTTISFQVTGRPKIKTPVCSMLLISLTFVLTRKLCAMESPCRPLAPLLAAGRSHFVEWTPFCKRCSVKVYVL
mmetsp:Transcript_6421/g.13043  ORF Transcript_6421/g.13043 Transcript_6421/m.13043 type:complete len:309 (-) Transcript_6421:67-993(-)